jgi:hypothetical protein
LKYDSDNATSVFNVSKQSDTGKLMQDCSLILWDEASQKSSIDALRSAQTEAVAVGVAAAKFNTHTF